VEEVVIGQCDAYCQRCVLSVMSSSRFPFQMTKWNQATAGASHLANVLFVEDGYRPLVLQKLS